MRATTIWAFLRGCSYITIMISTVAAVTTTDQDNIMPILALIGSMILMITAEIQYDHALEDEYKDYVVQKMEESYEKCIAYDIMLRRAKLIDEYAGGEQDG